jgi:hypothetical protein
MPTLMAVFMGLIQACGDDAGARLLEGFGFYPRVTAGRAVREHALGLLRREGGHSWDRQL